MSEADIHEDCVRQSWGEEEEAPVGGVNARVLGSEQSSPRASVRTWGASATQAEPHSLLVFPVAWVWVELTDLGFREDPLCVTPLWVLSESHCVGTELKTRAANVVLT